MCGMKSYIGKERYVELSILAGSICDLLSARGIIQDELCVVREIIETIYKPKEDESDKKEGMV